MKLLKWSFGKTEICAFMKFPWENISQMVPPEADQVASTTKSGGYDHILAPWGCHQPLRLRSCVSTCCNNLNIQYSNTRCKLRSVIMRGDLNKVTDAVKAWLSLWYNTWWRMIYHNCGDPQSAKIADPAAIDICPSIYFLSFIDRKKCLRKDPFLLSFNALI